MGNAASSSPSSSSSSPAGTASTSDAIQAIQASPARVAIVGAPGDMHLQVSFDGAGTVGIIAEAGAMVYKTPDVQVKTRLSGGVIKALKRVLASESAFVNTFYTENGQRQSMALSPDFPCGIVEVVLSPGEMFKAAAGAFLAADAGVSVSGRLTLLGGLLGQKDLVSVTVHNTSDQTDARVWLASNGASKAHKLEQGERLVVDNHRALAYSQGVTSELVKVGSIASAVFGGEGLAMMYTGPGTVYTQSRRSLPYLINKVVETNGSDLGGAAAVGVGVGGLAILTDAVGGARAGARKAKMINAKKRNTVKNRTVKKKHVTGI